MNKLKKLTFAHFKVKHDTTHNEATHLKKNLL